MRMETIQQGLEWNGDAYHKLSDMQYAVAMECLRRIELNGDETIVDAGCGSGRITREILARLPKGRLIGVDLSGSMLATARREVCAEPQQKVEFIQGDLQTFKLDRVAHGIFSNMALHFVHDHAQLFANFAHSLRPGGWLALQFGSSEQKSKVTMSLMKLMNSAPFAQFLKAQAFDFHGASVEATRTHLLAAGFVNLEVTAQPTPVTPAYAAKMVEFFRTTVAPDCHARLPTAPLREAFDGALNDMLAHSFDEPFDYIRVRATLAHVM